MSTYLSIAEFTIEIKSDIPVKLEIGYLPFISNLSHPKPDVIIHCHDGFPDLTSDITTPVFEAENETQKFYNIYQKGSELIFEMFDQQNINEVQQTAILSTDKSHWELYCKPEADGITLPLKYPFGPIMMHYLTQKTGSVMMHASCVFDGITGRVFTGFSGNGKSTMSQIWANAGSNIVNDDRIILREIDGQIFAYNTPMFYRDMPKKAPISAIYLISHSPTNKIKKVTGAMALSRTMAFCIQNNFDKNQINNQLNFFSKAIHLLQIFDLGFVPDENVISFVRENENE